MTPKPPDQTTEIASERPRLVEEELTGKVIGAFYTVYNKLGWISRVCVLAGPDDRAPALRVARRS
jgi:hypothetical protein